MNQTLPAWLVKLAVGALVTALIGGSLGWISHTSAQVDRIDKMQAVQESQQQNLKDDIASIKETQRRMEDKLDRVLSSGRR